MIVVVDVIVGCVVCDVVICAIDIVCVSDMLSKYVHCD